MPIVNPPLSGLECLLSCDQIALRDQLKRSLETWDTGKLRLRIDGIDVTAEHVADLRRIFDRMEKAVFAELND